jgi:Fe(3+) dicitrate transport protein
MLRGKMQDTELFSQVVHNPATRGEFIERVNQNRAAYELYLRDEEGNEILHQEPTLSPEDFERLTRALVQFGEGGFEGRLPYTPELNLSVSLNYRFGRLQLGAMGHYVGSQYTEFMNFANESADGSIGQLPAFFTMDAHANYDLVRRKNWRVQGFLNGKNISNQLFRASRLNRGTSGVFPGGFRQIIAGVTLNFG